MSRNLVQVLFVLFVFSILQGCAKDSDLERVNREQSATIQSLQDEVRRLNAQQGIAGSTQQGRQQYINK